MHTGVVALSHMDPKLLATILHTAFASGVELDERSRAGNVFHPATLFASRQTVSAAKQSLAEQRGASLPSPSAPESQDASSATAPPATATAAPSVLPAGTAAHAASGAPSLPATPTESAALLPQTNVPQSRGSSYGNDTSIGASGSEGLVSSPRRGTATPSQAATKQPALPLRAPWVPSQLQVPNDQAQDKADTAWTLLLHAYKGPDGKNQAAPQIATRLVGLQNSVLGMLAARHDATVVVALPVDIAGLPVPPADAVCRMLQPIGSGDGLKVSAAQYCKAAARRANAQNLVDKLLGLTSFGTSRGAGGGGAGAGGRFSRDSRASMTPGGRGFGGRSFASSSVYNNNSMNSTGRGSGGSIYNKSMHSAGRGSGGQSSARSYNGIGSHGFGNPGAGSPSATTDSNTRGGSSRPHSSGFSAASSQPPPTLGITTSFGQTGISPYGPKAGITSTFGQAGISPYGSSPSPKSSPCGTIGSRPPPPPPPASYGGGAFLAPPHPPPVPNSPSVASAPSTTTSGRPGRIPCKFFQEGRCAKGLACTFSHEASTSAAPGGVGVAAFGRGGRGRGFSGNSRGGYQG
ncbi:hypothetical protein DUNSADRAFT_2318 [Dunaliella salina]|uniref:C3H1-type domain-containing protein n=1 Tax=Dunaliella salina TaxID=3046 RepID=A0ABQ7FWF0_DUNSA|nr:hypothetical protein DUNSADRAFT_2318 [Dunaliella salina]|eukprot:KAF5826698.1 hypothetical protein DUNSADRAFT_2318 [Dunaliella salina]